MIAKLYIALLMNNDKKRPIEKWFLKIYIICIPESDKKNVFKYKVSWKVFNLIFNFLK